MVLYVCFFFFFVYFFFFFFCHSFFFFKQKTAYEIYQCDWSSDVCSSDLSTAAGMLINDLIITCVLLPEVRR